MSSNLILPKKIYAMYHFFEKCKKTDWLSLNFKTFKHDVFEKILFKIFSNTSYLK